MSEILTFRPSEPLPDYDALRCAAFAHAVAAGESGVCLVLVETSGETVSVVANVSAGEASVVLPLPKEIREESWGTLFFFPDEVYAVAENADTLDFAPEADFLVALDRAQAQIRVMRYDRETGEKFPVARSADGAACAAMVLHRDLENGTMESTVGQPGGILEIGMRKENGRVTGLSAGGPVEVTA